MSVTKALFVTSGGLNARGVALGLKLACGAELAYRQHKGGYDERREEQRHRFMRRMEAMGVFVGLAAGSKARKDKVIATHPLNSLSSCLELHFSDAMYNTESSIVRAVDFFGSPVVRLTRRSAL